MTTAASETPARTPRLSPPHPMARLRALDAIDRPTPVAPVAIALAVVALLAHVATNAMSPYGVHRDELLYLAMGRHLQLWRMDFPPGIALVAGGSRALFGDSLVALRLVPALAHAGIVLLAALAARDLGGRRWAQGAAALAALLGPLFLRAGNLLQPVVLEQLAWTVALLLLARLGTREGREARGTWLALGVAAGAGLLLKFSALYFGAAMAVALLATPLRRSLATRWPWLALAIALAIGSPGIVGQVALDYPVVGQMRDLQEAQLARMSAGEFLGEQLLFGPGTILGLAGLVALLAARWARPWRAVGITALASLGILLALKGKGYYFGPMYPVLFAAGAVAVERMRARRRATVARWGTVAAIVAYGAITLPIGLPFLEPHAMARYAMRLGIAEATESNRGEQLALPQDYADMLPWEEEAAAVAEAWRTLTPAEQREAVILPDNYGEAGAIDFHGPALGLPPAVLPTASYWYFGPGEKPGRILVTLGVDSTDLAAFYGDVRVIRRDFTPHELAVPEERELDILIARQPKTTLQAIWPQFEGRN